MPRDGTGVYTYPAGTEGVPDTSIESAKYNAYINDAQNDANNARPIIAGGTGGSTAADARSNLGVLAATGGTMTGSIIIAPPSGNAGLTLTKPASGQTSFIASYTAVNLRWSMALGNATPETGANAGSDFEIARYTDAGTVFGGSPALTINRATGAAAINGATTINGAATINGATTITGAANVVGVTTFSGGDTWFQRLAAPTQGLIQFGNAGNKYIHFDDSKFLVVGAPWHAPGIVSSTTLACTTSASVGTTLSVGSTMSAAGTISATGELRCVNTIRLSADNTRYLHYDGGANYNYHLGGSGVVITSGNWTSYISVPPAPLQALRWVHQQDKNVANFTMNESDFGGHCVYTGYAWFNFDNTARFRILQYLDAAGTSWVTIGAAS